MKNKDGNNVSKTERSNYSHDGKKNAFSSPDVSKMQVVVIDGKTRLYIAMDADPDLARSRYMSRMEAKANFFAKKVEAN